MQARTPRVRKLIASLVFAAGGLLASSAFAALSVNPIFGSDMVLQRGVAVPVFGTGDVGATVTVNYQNQNVSTVVPSSGTWLVNLASMPASASPSTMTVSQNGANPATFTYTGVQVGEVWVCSGQSNMNFPMRNADYNGSYVSDSANHNIRLFRMNGGSGPSTTTWTTANPTTVPNFTAVGYWMGYELSTSLNVPIGLIQAAHDGTNISSWQTTDGGDGADYIPMLKALQPFPIKGVAWYQGESNGGDAAYATKLTHMINEWRTDWGNPNLWFGIVQLPYPKWNPAGSAEFNVSQSVAGTYLAVTMDLYNSQILHPTDKRPVGRRLGIGARGLIYSEAIETSGPVRALPPGSYVSGNKVVLNFSHLGNGLATKNGLAPIGFQLADSGGRYVTATATIVGNTIEVTASRVSSPKKLAYSFSTVGNVCNMVNIPVEGGAATETTLPVALFEMTLP